MEEQAKAQETQSTEKAEETKCACSPKGLMKIILGVVLILLGLAAVIGWWSDLWTLIKGAIGLFLIMAGAITIAIAKE